MEENERRLILLDAIFSALNIDSEEELTRLVNSLISNKAVSEDGSDPNLAFKVSIKQNICFTLHLCPWVISIHPPRVLTQYSLYIIPPWFSKFKKLKMRFKAILSYLNGNLTSREPGFFSGKRSTEGGWNWETWKTLKNTISDKKLRLWDALYEALKKYYDTLAARSG